MPALRPGGRGDGAGGVVSDLAFDFLLDGSRRADDVARELIAFLDAARSSIDVAIYDFQARSGATAHVADALEEAAARGVSVRVAFNVERRQGAGDPPDPKSPPEHVDGLDVPTRGVSGNGALMHHKYVVRDGADVWTGSTNWTDDAFGREENAVVRLTSRPSPPHTRPTSRSSGRAATSRTPARGARR